MNLKERLNPAAILATTVICAFLGMIPVAGCAADVPGADTTVKPTGSREQILSDYRSVSAEVDGLTDGKALDNQAELNAIAPTAVPLIHRQLKLIDDLQAAHAVGPEQVFPLQVHPNALLYLMKDPATVDKLNHDAASSDPQKMIAGQTVLLYARWISADKDSFAKVVDDLDKLDRAHPESTQLTQLTATFGSTAPTLETASHMEKLLSDVMTSPTARQFVAQRKRQAELDSAKSTMVNKPFSIAAKTVQGAPFSSESLKGKVVLVDFWATWCPPCKAIMPHVKVLYSRYHDKGFEIVGVSSDYAAKDVLEFTSQNSMPWTQLFDPAAAAQQQWHPLCDKNNIEQLPSMFIIDKKGILRSVTAEENMDAMIPVLLAE